MNPKIKTVDELVSIVEKAKSQGKIVVTTNGCFDLLHVGHVTSLAWTKAQGDILIVGLNSDASVKSIKDAERRPIISQAERALMLAALESVDYVLIFDESSPMAWIEKLKPDVHVKGQGSETVPMFHTESAVVVRNGGRVALAPKLEGWSTTDIIADIIRKYGAKP